MEKKPFVTLEQLKEIDKTYPTPYHRFVLWYAVSRGK